MSDERTEVLTAKLFSESFLGASARLKLAERRFGFRIGSESSRSCKYRHLRTCLVRFHRQFAQAALALDAIVS